jgi:hypothetical protein
VFAVFDAHFLARSLDEAFLDVTRLCRERRATGAQLAGAAHGPIT